MFFWREQLEISVVLPFCPVEIAVIEIAEEFFGLVPMESKESIFLRAVADDRGAEFPARPF